MRFAQSVILITQVSKGLLMLVDVLIASKENTVCNNNGLRSLPASKRSRAQALLFDYADADVSVLAFVFLDVKNSSHNLTTTRF